MEIRQVTRRVALVVSLLALGTVPSCKTHSTEPKIDAGVIMPMAPGDTWNYGSAWFDSTGVVTYSFTVEMSTYGPDTVGSFIGYGFYNFLLWPLSILFENEPDGVYSTNDPSAELIGTGPSSPQPIEIDKALSYPTYPGDTLTYRGYLIRTQSINEMMTVPAGSFKCIHYDAYSADVLSYQLWLSPNVGMVRVWRKLGPQVRVDSLQTYQLH